MDQLSIGPIMGNTHISSGEVHHLVASPQIAYQSGNVVIYHQNDVGIKVILGHASSEEKAVCLAHEKNISDFLPGSCNKREVFCVQSFNGVPALYFKWSGGTTLKQWLHDAHAQADLNLRLRAAAAIAKTLHEFHSNGVGYNNLLPENIVLDTLGGNYIATFIDLSRSLVMTTDDLEAKEYDLHNLGHILNMLFVGEASPNECGSFDSYNILGESYLLPINSNEDISRRKRGRQQTVGEGLPLYLESMISSLHLKGNGNTLPSNLCYSNSHDVFLDLKFAVENPHFLTKYQLDNSTSDQGRLRLKNDVFHGRKVQISMLNQIFEIMVATGNQSMAVISGCPGSGKSSLANQMRKHIESSGFFIEGKFNKETPRPDTILVSALNSFFGVMIHPENQNELFSIQCRIKGAIGSTNSPLMDIIPNLRKFLTENSNENSPVPNPTYSAGGLRSSQGLNILICKLIGAIGCSSTPLILCLDDLQWADKRTLDIIRMLMVDPDISHFLLLACYRDNEVKTTHPLMSTVDGIVEHGSNVVKIQLGAIEKESVNSLVSETLCLPPNLCKTLSATVHNKTGGIVLFILTLLITLNEEGLLWYGIASRRWEFNLDAICSKEMSGDVLQHMALHMTGLPKQMQLTLKIAACLGTSFPKKVALLAGGNLAIQMESILDSCVDCGYMQESSSSTLAWAHDFLQQAAYDLIPFAKRESFHLLLGTRLFMNSSSNDIDEFIFFIVDNMDRGRRLIEGSEQKYDLSSLNLRAGEKYMITSAFHSAVKYFMIGIELLENDSWETKYDLTMKIFDAATEVLFVTGDFSEMTKLIDEQSKHARCFEDTLNAYNNLVRAQAALGNVKDGIDKCLFVLNRLGENIPDTITGKVFQDEAFRIQQLLKGKSHDNLISLPLMANKNKLSAMQFMNQALSLTFIAKPILNPILVFRMVKMTIEYGTCKLSSFAFGCYGGWLVSANCSDFDGGYKMGRVATDLMEHLGAFEVIPRLYLVLYTFINIWKEPFQASLSKHFEAYDIGSSTGDTEYGFSNLLQYSILALYGCGESLKDLAQRMQVHAKRAIQYKQMLVAKTMIILVQLALDLMGEQENAYSLLSDGVNEPSVFALAQENNEKSICRFICLKRKYLAFFSGDLDTAALTSEMSQQFLDASTGRTLAVVIGTFFDGLIALYFARKHRDDEEKWKRVAESIIETVKQWDANSAWNFSNKLLLLEAEYFFLTDDYNQAACSYEASIKAAKDHRFIHEEGLALEKAATFFLHQGEHQKALEYFINAKECYSIWGAYSLEKRMNKAIAAIAPMFGI